MKRGRNGDTKGAFEKSHVLLISKNKTKRTESRSDQRNHGARQSEEMEEETKKAKDVFVAGTTTAMPCGLFELFGFRKYSTILSSLERMPFRYS